MSLLKPAANQTAFLKAGIMGFAGSGKTFTAKELAIGLAHDVGDDKPVAFFDTEHGSDYLIPAFKAAKVELLVAKTRAFRDLLTFMDEAESQCSVAIIDSISHVWTELLAAYQAKKRVKRLGFEDWAPIKQEWRQFTDRYLNSRLHVILCGRAGYEYEMERDEETGKKELFKTGTKMKAETEMGYEPSLLMEMWRVKKSELARDASVHGWIHRCVILKDRTDQMNGEEIDNPTYESFQPVMACLNIGGTHSVIDTTRNSEGLFDSPDSASRRFRQVKIALEEIQEALELADYNTRTTGGKKQIRETLAAAFGTGAWSKIETFSLEELELGLGKLRDALGQTPAPEGTVDAEEAEQDRDLNFDAPEPGGLSKSYFARINALGWDTDTRRAWQQERGLEGSCRDWTVDMYRRAHRLLDAEEAERAA